MRRFAALALLVVAGTGRADPPVAQFLFPAGGQRGTTVDLRVGGLYLYETCDFELLGPGVTAPPKLNRVASPTFEGPILPLPESQRQEDYPRTMFGRVAIANDAPIGPRYGHVWTSQGVSPTPAFVVGDLPEVTEIEAEGEAVAVEVAAPVTVNGRIYPREDVDVWSFRAKAGAELVCRAEAGQFGSPLVPRFTLLADGRRVAESNIDGEIRFTAPSDGLYEVRIADVNVNGGPAYVYRLTIAPAVRSPATPLGCIDKPGDVDEWPIAVRKGVPVEIAIATESRLIPVSVLIADGKEVAKLEGVGVLSHTPAADGTLTLRVRDQFAGRGGPDFRYTLRSEVAKPDFDLEMIASSLTVYCGGEAKLKVNARRRGGFNAPIAVRVNGLPNGVTAAPAVFQPGQASIDVSLKADAKAAIRCDRVTVEGTARMSVHPLTAVPVAVTRTATFRDRAEVRLAVAIPTPFKIAGDYALKLVPRGTVYVRRFKIERTGYDGPIEIALADRQARHLQGASGPTFVVPAGKSEFDYPTTLPPWMETGRTCRVCVMGTAKIKDADGSEHVVSYSSVQQNDQIIAVVEPGRLGVELDRSSVLAVPGAVAELRVRVARGSDLRGPAKVECVFPNGFDGATVEPLTIAADQTEGKLVIRFDANRVRPVAGLPVVVRATVADGATPVFAEARLDIVK